jgi:hypothetical protein
MKQVPKMLGVVLALYMLTPSTNLLLGSQYIE